MYKRIVAILAIIMCMAGVVAPVYAQTENGTESTESIEDTENTEPTEVTVTTPTPTPEVITRGNAFTEEGNGELGDTLNSDDKEFMTVTTKAGNTFYLVIDRSRDSDNVYFLNKVDESDLQAFAQEVENKDSSSVISLPSKTETADGADELQEKKEEKLKEIEEAKAKEEQRAEEQKAKGQRNYVILGIVAVGAGVVAYMMKKRKKNDDPDDDDPEDEYEDEPDDEYEDDEETEDGEEVEESDDSEVENEEELEDEEPEDDEGEQNYDIYDEEDY